MLAAPLLTNFCLSASACHLLDLFVRCRLQSVFTFAFVCLNCVYVYVCVCLSNRVRHGIFEAYLEMSVSDGK